VEILVPPGAEEKLGTQNCQAEYIVYISSMKQLEASKHYIQVTLCFPFFHFILNPING
jgi:hypothetical protein